MYNEYNQYEVYSNLILKPKSRVNNVLFYPTKGKQFIYLLNFFLGQISKNVNVMFSFPKNRSHNHH